MHYTKLKKDQSFHVTYDQLIQIIDKIGIQIKFKKEFHPFKKIYSTFLVVKNHNYLYSNGKGSSLIQSRVSALGEFIERLSTNFYFYHFNLSGSLRSNSQFLYYPDEVHFQHDRFLSPNHKSAHTIFQTQFHSFFNPNNSLKLSHIKDSHYMPSTCVMIPFHDMITNKKTLIPIKFLTDLYGSNGMSSGNSLYESRIQALCEIIERYVKFEVIQHGYSLPDAPLSSFHPKFIEIINHIKKFKYHVFIKDASLGGCFPVMNVCLVDLVNNRCMTSFGSHPDRNIALDRALTEAFQGRDSNQSFNFNHPSFDPNEVNSEANCLNHFIDSTGLLHWNYFNKKHSFEFKNWNHSSKTSKNDYNTLLKLIKKNQWTTYIREFNQFGFYACQILIPTISEIYPVTDLITEDHIKNFTASIIEFNILNKNQLMNLYDQLTCIHIPEYELLKELLGIISDKNCFWNTATMGELLCLLNFLIDKKRDFKKYLQWVIDFMPPNHQRIQIYRSLQIIYQLNTKIQDYTIEPFIHDSLQNKSLEYFKTFHNRHEYVNQWIVPNKPTKHRKMIKLYLHLNEFKTKPLT